MNPEAALGLKVPPILFEGDTPASAHPTRAEPKFALGPPSQGPAETPEPTLPESYGSGRLWLAPRDPHCLYAHWDLSPEQQQSYKNAAQEEPLTLRIHLPSLKDSPVAEVKLALEPRHRFIHVPFAGERYIAELGYLQPDRRWKALAVSEVTATPVENIARDKTIRFATIRTAAAAPSSSSGQLAPANAPGEFPEPASQGPAQPPDSILSNATPTRVPDPGEIAAPLLAVPVAADLIVPAATPGSHQLPLESFPDWTPLQEEALAEWLGMDDLQTGPVSSFQAAPLAPHLPPSPFRWAPGPDITSPAGGELPPPPGFWFNVNAELVIYGATEPNAQVTIGGRPIQLRPDGSFSYRFLLPDGHYELAIAAVSARGDMRRAELAFDRRSHYEGQVDPHPQDSNLKTPAPGNLT